MTKTRADFWVSPGAKVSVPDAATKSDALACPGVVDQSTVTGLPIARDNVIGTSIAVVPLSPSTTVAAPGSRTGGRQPGDPGTQSATTADGVLAAKSPGLEPPLERAPMPVPTTRVPSSTAAPEPMPEKVPGSADVAIEEERPVGGVVEPEGGR